MRATIFAALVAMTLVICLTASTPEKKQDTKPVAAAAVAKAVKISDIPGITTADRTPDACVNCHANHPEMKKDFRLTTELASWQKTGADSAMLAKALAAAPAGKVYSGKHPDIKALVFTIPDDCLMCHVRDSRVAPPFTKLLHAIHLVGGKENHFLTNANGTCTSCHKLDQQTGFWGLGSGVEN
jgi:hypothetical protein